MNKEFNDVVVFHHKFQLRYDGMPRLLPDNLLRFRLDFMHEEIDELRDGVQRLDLVADALIDEVYVIFGTAYLMGLHHWIDQPRFSDVSDVHMHFGRWASSKPVGDAVKVSIASEGFIETLRHFHKMHNMQHLMSADMALRSLVHDIYVLAIDLHLPWHELWDEVQRANMSKQRATADNHGKRLHEFDIVKPDGWQPPDIVGVLTRFGALL